MDDNREVIALSKDGTKMAKIKLQPLYYLQTEHEWIFEKLLWYPAIDGVAFKVDWEKRDITMIRNALED